MKVNFFDKGSVIKAFSELYGMNEGELIPLSYEANLEDDPTHYFLEHYPIQLDMIDARLRMELKYRYKMWI